MASPLPITPPALLHSGGFVIETWYRFGESTLPRRNEVIDEALLPILRQANAVHTYNLAAAGLGLTYQQLATDMQALPYKKFDPLKVR